EQKGFQKIARDTLQGKTSITRARRNQADKRLNSVIQVFN
ncbi:MAG: DNA-binding phage protein, partial [Cyclobacteriaceae bacterium]